MVKKILLAAAFLSLGIGQAHAWKYESEYENMEQRKENEKNQAIAQLQMKYQQQIAELGQGREAEKHQLQQELSGQINAIQQQFLQREGEYKSQIAQGASQLQIQALEIEANKKQAALDQKLIDSLKNQIQGIGQQSQSAQQAIGNIIDPIAKVRAAKTEYNKVLKELLAYQLEHAKEKVAPKNKKSKKGRHRKGHHQQKEQLMDVKLEALQKSVDTAKSTLLALSINVPVNNQLFSDAEIGTPQPTPNPYGPQPTPIPNPYGPQPTPIPNPYGPQPTPNPYGPKHHHQTWQSKQPWEQGYVDLNNPQAVEEAARSHGFPSQPYGQRYY